jgi:hypothetical protein
VHAGRTVLLASVAAAAVATALAVVVTQPETALRADPLDGGACVSFDGGGSTPDATVASVTIRNRSEHAVQVIAAAPIHPVDASDVQLRLLPGDDKGPNGFSAGFDGLSTPGARNFRGASLPPHATSTILVGIERPADSTVATIDGVELTYRGPLGTVRTMSVGGGLGITATGATDRCIARWPVPDTP